VHAHTDAQYDRTVAFNRCHHQGLLGAVANDDEIRRGFGAVLPHRGTELLDGVHRLAVHGGDHVALDKGPCRGRVVQDAGDRDLTGEVVLELDEGRGDRILLGVDHRRLVLRVAVGVAQAGREDRLDGNRGPGTVEPRAEHLEPVGSLARPAEHRDGQEVELPVGRERLLVGDLDERNLFALVLRDPEGVVDGPGLLDDVRRREQREHHGDDDGDHDRRPPDPLPAGAALRARRRVVVEEGHPCFLPGDRSRRASAWAGVVREGRTPGRPSLGHFPDRCP
jgi:hypothetical protein